MICERRRGEKRWGYDNDILYGKIGTKTVPRPKMSLVERNMKFHFHKNLNSVEKYVETLIKRCKRRRGKDN